MKNTDPEVKCHCNMFFCWSFRYDFIICRSFYIDKKKELITLENILFECNASKMSLMNSTSSVTLQRTPAAFLRFLYFLIFAKCCCCYISSCWYFSILWRRYIWSTCFRVNNHWCRALQPWDHETFWFCPDWSNQRWPVKLAMTIPCFKFIHLRLSIHCRYHDFHGN
jgi:hypothetical protein